MKKHLLMNVTVLSCLLLTSLNSYAQDKARKRSDRKIIEISKIVQLSKKQEDKIRQAYDAYILTVDSCLNVETDAIHAAEMKYRANKVFHNTLMSTLHDNQRLRYIQVTSTPEVEAKTRYKLEVLKESGEYSDEELDQMHDEIFDYLMSEKVVYFRDKYQIQKQKENISRLKNVQPRALKESNTREKMKGQGRLRNGKVKW